MSTKITSKQISNANNDLRENSRRFRKQKRVTKQVRINILLHKKLKLEARKGKKTISRLLDELLYKTDGNFKHKEKQNS